MEDDLGHRDTAAPGPVAGVGLFPLLHIASSPDGVGLIVMMSLWENIP